MQDWKLDYNEVTKTLSKYGWFVTPSISGGDFQEIQKLCDKINQTNFSETEINEEINEVILPVIFNPSYRAFTVFKYIKLNHLRKFSHLIDRAVFHYYKKDFLSAIFCMLSVIEGVLLSFSNWDYNSEVRKPSLKKLINKFCETPIHTLNSQKRKLYSEVLNDCLSNWFFADTSQFNFSYSFLNRHFITHSMGNENYYSVLECNRMLTIIDLIAEVIVQDEFYQYAFIPSNEPIIDLRRDYYFRLINKRIHLKVMVEIESNLLKQNQFYLPTENNIDFHKVMSDANKRIAEFQKELNEKFPPHTEKTSFLIKFFRKIKHSLN